MTEYIERKAALAKTCEGCVEANDGTCEHKCADYCAIAKLPAADVVKVRHGYWEYVGLGGALWCSECKKQSSHMGYATNKFCPNCGAKMDKKQDR